MPALRRQERFASVTSTNDVVRAWLAAGEPEICVAVADEQTAGRGRNGRTWTAPPGAGLLLSLGFRPTWLAPDRVWRLAATVSLAMAEAAEEIAGLPDGAVGLKWPNDLVIDLWTLTGIPWRNVATGGVNVGSDVRKLGGVLGETTGLGTADPTAIVGIGVNVGWSPDSFPPELVASMTSLTDATAGRPVDRDALLEAFRTRFGAGVAALRDDDFDAEGWEARQVLTGDLVEVHAPDGGVRVARAIGVDTGSGALVIDDDGTDRPLFVGDIRHVRPVMV